MFQLIETLDSKSPTNTKETSNQYGEAQIRIRSQVGNENRMERRIRTKNMEKQIENME